MTPHSSPSIRAFALPPPAAPPGGSGSPVPTLSSLEGGDSSDDEELLEGESAAEMLAGLRAQLESLSDASRAVRHQVRGVYRRARLEATEWMDTPLRPRTPYGGWMRAAGLPAAPTIRAFLGTVFRRALSLDLTTRRLHFTQEDAEALWDGRRLITIFDVMEALPRLFQ